MRCAAVRVEATGLGVARSSEASPNEGEMTRHRVTVITPQRGGSVVLPTTPRSKGYKALTTRLRMQVVHVVVECRSCTKLNRLPTARFHGRLERLIQGSSHERCQSTNGT